MLIDHPLNHLDLHFHSAAGVKMVLQRIQKTTKSDENHDVRIRFETIFGIFEEKMEQV